MDNDKNGVTWTISSHVRATINNDGGVLLDIEKGLCYSLNPVGARIWQAIESRRSGAKLEDVVTALASQFTIAREQLARDIDEYLLDLEKRGLIKALSPQLAAKRS